MNSENPYLPPRTQSEQAISEVRAASHWPRRFLFLQLLVVTLGILVAYFINIESIIVTGLVLVLVGLLLSIFSWLDKDLCSLACGVSGVAFSVFIFGSIYHNAWSPIRSKEAGSDTGVRLRDWVSVVGWVDNLPASRRCGAERILISWWRAWSVS